jgi:hypothetical protein
VKIPVVVPVMVDTDTRNPVAAFSLPKPNAPAGTVHRIVDAEIHDVVVHEVIENVPTVGVRSASAKL